MIDNKGEEHQIWSRQIIYRMTWRSFDKYSIKLKNFIVNSNFQPSILICIANGGLTLGVKLSHLLNIRNLRVIRIKRNDTNDIFTSRSYPIVEWEYIGDLTGHNVLLIDDIVGSGMTMKSAYKVIEIHNLSLIHI